VFGQRKVAVFVDGCFWHGCPQHYTSPQSNASYWRAKINSNQVRDRRVNKELAIIGWDVVRIWEHEVRDDIASAVAAVEHALRSGKDFIHCDDC
jgi:DNA mismatch endonuclease, patch repair protein